MKVEKAARLVLAVSVVLVICAPVVADELHVPSEYGTIQAAINACNHLDTVVVADGTYTGSGNKNLDFGGKAITVQSENGPQLTIIDCENSGRGFYFHSGEDDRSVVDGFTIKNGREHSGGGIECEDSSPTIENCIIRDNEAVTSGIFLGEGGGIHAYQSRMLLKNCQFMDNTSSGGGGAICSYSFYGTGDILVLNCVFNGNSANGGGAIHCYKDNISLYNCVISNNDSSKFGGGVNFQMITPIIGNCTITGNSAGERGGGIYCLGGSTTVINTILWGNGAPTGSQIKLNYPSSGTTSLTISYSNVQGGVGAVSVDGGCILNWGVGNSVDDPCFITGPFGDYYLSQTAAGQGSDSPCVDAGSDTAANLGMDEFTTRTDQRADDGVVDMGYHYLSALSVYHVDGTTGDNGNDGLTRETAFATIQRGIDEANDCNTVVVWPGLYNESLLFQNKGITVKSAADAAVIEASGVYGAQLFTSEGPNTIFENFVITNSDTGIFVLAGSPTLRNLTIADCNLGINAQAGAEPHISNCILWDNDTDLFQCQTQYSLSEEEESNGVVSYWELDETSGTIAFDSVGNNDGTLINGPVWTTGQVNGALEFDGINDYVEIADDDSLTPPTEITIAFWIYRTANIQSGGIQKYAGCPDVGGSPGNSRAYRLLVSGANQIYFTIFSAVSTYDTLLGSTTDISLNKWYHIAATFNAGAANIYLDGNLDNSTTMSVSSIMNDAQPLMIGARWSWCDSSLYDLMNGSIDEVMIFDRALSAGEILEMYQVGLGGHSFYGAPLFADAETSDYHLLSERGRYWPAHDVWVLDDVTSPCIDAGDPNIEPTAEPKPNGGRINMGAYGNTAYASMSEWSIFGDINQDGIVDGKDFAIVAGDWLEKAAWKD